MLPCCVMLCYVINRSCFACGGCKPWYSGHVILYWSCYADGLCRACWASGGCRSGGCSHAMGSQVGVPNPNHQILTAHTVAEHTRARVRGCIPLHSGPQVGVGQIMPITYVCHARPPVGVAVLWGLRCKPDWVHQIHRHNTQIL